MVPVTSHFDGVVGDHHDMKGPREDGVVTAGADIGLHRLIRLDGVDVHPAKIAHAMTARMASTAKTTIAMSSAVFWCSRNGLKPT